MIPATRANSTKNGGRVIIFGASSFSAVGLCLTVTLFALASVSSALAAAVLLDAFDSFGASSLFSALMVSPFMPAFFAGFDSLALDEVFAADVVLLAVFFFGVFFGLLSVLSCSSVFFASAMITPSFPVLIICCLPFYRHTT